MRTGAGSAHATARRRQRASVESALLQSRGERGGTTVMAVSCAGLLIVLGAALGVVAAMVVAHRTAQSAADLAALAGASEVVDGDPCGRAADVAGANGAALETCQVDGADVRVTVSVEGPHWLGQQSDLEATARAGPLTSAP